MAIYYPNSATPWWGNEEYRFTSTEATEWEAIDEAIPDGNTSYITSTVNLSDVMFGLTGVISDILKTWYINITLKLLPQHPTYSDDDIWIWLLTNTRQVYGGFPISYASLTEDWQTITVEVLVGDGSGRDRSTQEEYIPNSVEIMTIDDTYLAITALSVSDSMITVPSVSIEGTITKTKELPSTIFTLVGTTNAEDYLWSVISGDAVIDDPTSLTAQVVFANTGTATVRLTATNDNGSVYDEVTLTVNEWPDVPAWASTGKIALDLHYHPRHLGT